MRAEQIVVPAVRALARWDWTQRPLRWLLAPMNPLDPQRYSDPYPLYETARAAGGPIFYHRRLRTWQVTGYEECEAVLRGPVSVDRSNLIETVSPYSKLTAETRDLFLSTMLMTDPPEHSRLRTLVNRAFTPRAVAALEPRIEEITAELIADLQQTDGPVEAMGCFADLLPIYAIAEMIGLPTDDRVRLKAISDVAAQFIDPLTGFDPTTMDRSIAEFRHLVDDLLTTDTAGDGLLAALATAETDGDRLAHDELISMVLLLMVAGHETTSSLIGNSLIHLDTHRAARQRLATEPDLAANAVEELLRFDPPVQGTDRIALEAFDVGDHHIEAGANIIVLLAAANRDPRRYDSPDILILDRPDPRPISFGHGVHHCLGAALARLEARIALPAFAAAFPDHRVLHDQVQWNRSITLRGPTRLPMQLR